MSQDLGSAYSTAALPFAPPRFPANASPNRRPFAMPSFAQGTASWKHSVFASTFLLAYIATFFGVGYAALTAVVWAWTAIFR
jgi:hypothetical protein